MDKDAQSKCSVCLNSLTFLDVCSGICKHRLHAPCAWRWALRSTDAGRSRLQRGGAPYPLFLERDDALGCCRSRRCAPARNVATCPMCRGPLRRHEVLGRLGGHCVACNGLVEASDATFAFSCCARPFHAACYEDEMRRRYDIEAFMLRADSAGRRLKPAALRCLGGCSLRGAGGVPEEQVLAFVAFLRKTCSFRGDYGWALLKVAGRIVSLLRAKDPDLFREGEGALLRARGAATPTACLYLRRACGLDGFATGQDLERGVRELGNVVVRSLGGVGELSELARVYDCGGQEEDGASLAVFVRSALELQLLPLKVFGVSLRCRDRSIRLLLSEADSSETVRCLLYELSPPPFVGVVGGCRDWAFWAFDGHSRELEWPLH